MCPVCLTSMAWLITGGVSVLGATAGGVAIVRDRREEVERSTTTAPHNPKFKTFFRAFQKRKEK